MLCYVFLMCVYFYNVYLLINTHIHLLPYLKSDVLFNAVVPFVGLKKYISGIQSISQQGRSLLSATYLSPVTLSNLWNEVSKHVNISTLLH